MFFTSLNFLNLVQLAMIANSCHFVFSVFFFNSTRHPPHAEARHKRHLFSIEWGSPQVEKMDREDFDKK